MTSSNLLLIVLGGLAGVLLPTIVSFLAAARRSRRLKVLYQELERAEAEADWSRASGELAAARARSEQHTRTGEPVEPGTRLFTDMSADALAQRLHSLGVDRYEVDDDGDAILFAAKLGENSIAFRIEVDENLSGLSITSTALEIERERITADAALRLLELNSENKIGSIGLQHLAPRARYRVWVDYYLKAEDGMPSADALRTCLFALTAVQGEVLDVLARTEPAKTRDVP